MVARPNHPIEKVRELQRRLYIAAKRNEERRFHALYNLWRLDVPLEAWTRSATHDACMRHVKTIGKPDAGNSHVRFERGPQETEPERHRA